MRCLGALIGIAVLLVFLGVSSSAVEVVEAWRSSWGTPWSVSVNAADGSCWVGIGTRVMHVAADGRVLSETPGFSVPLSVSANPTDGSCWVTDTYHQQVVKLSEDGQEVLRLSGFALPACVSTNPADGSCWVADTYAHQVVHIAGDGTVLWRGGEFYIVRSVSVNPADGSCWVTDTSNNQMVRLASDGSEQLRVSGFICLSAVAASPLDGSCWVTNVIESSDVGFSNAVTHISADGVVLSQTKTGAFTYAIWASGCLSVNPTDGSCWVADTDDNEVAHLDEDGTEIWRGGGFSFCRSVAVDPVDGSCWVAQTGHDQIQKAVWMKTYTSVMSLAEEDASSALVHLASDGTELWRRRSCFSYPHSVSADPWDGSCWVADACSNQVVHLAEDGTELWRGGGFDVVPSVSVNSVVLLAEDGTELWLGDGSCWVADTFHSEVVHLGADGTELWRGGGFASPWSVSVNPRDGSCWVTDAYPEVGGVVHLAADGTVLSSSSGFCVALSVSANAEDGSCWVADSSNHHQVVHLGADGGELSRFPTRTQSSRLLFPEAVSVNSADGSCWIADWGLYDVVKLSAGGTELSRVGGYPDYGMPLGIACDPQRDSCWVSAGDLMVLLAGDGTELWRDHHLAGTTGLSVNYADGSCWVADTHNGEIVHLIVPATFADVPYTHWAADQIAACVAAGIVAGFEDHTYRPTLAVTRDQMAVYISRALAGGDEHVPSGPTEPSFPDVPVEHWAYQYVEYAAASGIVGGYDDGTYRPTDNVDRAQMAVFAARAIVTPHGDDGLAGYTPPATPTFPDVATDHWAYKYIEYITQQGVTQGYDDGTYRPGSVVTRDQMAVYIQRAFGLPA